MTGPPRKQHGQTGELIIANDIGTLNALCYASPQVHQLLTEDKTRGAKPSQSHKNIPPTVAIKNVNAALEGLNHRLCEPVA